VRPHSGRPKIMLVVPPECAFPTHLLQFELGFACFFFFLK